MGDYFNIFFSLLIDLFVVKNTDLFQPHSRMNIFNLDTVTV